MNYYGNMGPFDPVSFKGNARVNGVPVFVDKLPLTIGGIAGEDVKFGRVVSVNPANRRDFFMGVKAGYIVKGISMLDPTIMRADPGMQDYYFAGRPMTATTMGIVEISEYDTTKLAPVEGSTVWCRNSDGVIAFGGSSDSLGTDYTRLNAYVYETIDPNGAKIAFGLPSLVATQTVENAQTAVTPVATPLSGAVAAGTAVTLSTTTKGAPIYYTLDGTEPNLTSPIYSGPISITSGVTIKAKAIVQGMNPSTTLEAAYTIS